MDAGLARICWACFETKPIEGFTETELPVFMTIGNEKPEASNFAIDVCGDCYLLRNRLYDEEMALYARWRDFKRKNPNVRFSPWYHTEYRDKYPSCATIEKHRTNKRKREEEDVTLTKED